MPTKKIVIIGGGYAGCKLAKALDAVASVTLIDGKDCFVHAPAAIRAVADNTLLDQLIIPYSNFLQQGQFVEGWVEQINSDGVILSDGRELKSDITVVATGSSYAAPFKHTRDGLDAFRKNSEQAASKVRQAKVIAIVGAGPVGTELAGEIACAYPDKEIHLITDEQSLYPMYNPSLAKKLQADFTALGVHLHTGKRVENLASLTEPYKGDITFAGGKTISADLVFPVIGSRPQTQLLAALTDVKFASDGRAEQDGWMRPSKSNPNLFVIGDALCAGDAMTIVAISRQVPWLVKTLKAVFNGKTVDSQKPYKPWVVAPILIPMGPKMGASVLPFGKKEMTVGHFMTSRLKGKDLFLSTYRKFFGSNE
ncbi:FAD-dependent oxidoreductase [Paraglaciecola sp. 20A4]|uniref:NAD(P)/FAD-dependent oxidoreductase n=1 Tax=Paraglaciecola sp. 20A4 TaxID=2687288 RepID=UPI00140D7892|nr:FAD-dependent oxidoreductase [Paraglaciecola sp. 20A4]